MATIAAEDRRVLRELAQRVAELAELPVMAERRELWRRHNQLDSVRPMMLVFPEGSWRELLPESSLACEEERARAYEAELRRRIFYREQLHDDTVISRGLVVHKVIHSTGWGLQAKQIPSTEALGSWAFDPVIRERADLRKLHYPEITYDEAATEERLGLAQDLFGDILDVRLKGADHISFHLMSQYTSLRGLNEAMIDMVTEPQMVHDAMAMLCEGNRRCIEQLEEQHLLSLNNDGTYHSSGGVGYTKELPQPDHAPNHIRPRDMWASAESQELAQVSPEMHAEFALAYERQLLEPFGLTGYGCCEDLTLKLDDVMAIPNLRRISISPFADVEKCAKKLGDGYIFSWKPHPAHLAGGFDVELIRAYIGRTLEATKGCVVEMILKDTHTCDGKPERFTRWSEIARELVDGVAR